MLSWGSNPFFVFGDFVCHMLGSFRHARILVFRLSKFTDAAIDISPFYWNVQTSAVTPFDTTLLFRG